MVRTRSRASTGRANRPTIMRSSAPGKPSSRSTVDCRPASDRSALPCDDGGAEVRHTVDSLADGTADTAPRQQIVDRGREGRRHALHGIERDAPSSFEQADRRSQAPVGRLDSAIEVIDGDRSDDGLFSSVAAGVIQLVGVRTVGASTFAGVGLTDDGVDEMDSVAATVLELLHRRGGSARHRARVADEVQQHWPPAQVEKMKSFPVGGFQVEVGCLAAERDAVPGRTCGAARRPDAGFGSGGS